MRTFSSIAFDVFTSHMKSVIDEKASNAHPQKRASIYSKSLTAAVNNDYSYYLFTSCLNSAEDMKNHVASWVQQLPATVLSGDLLSKASSIKALIIT